MTLNPAPDLLNALYWVTLLAVVVSSASAVLKTGAKQFDLFGVIIIAIATGLGGGSLRDMLLDREVFWIRDQAFFFASLGSAFAMFLLARRFDLSSKWFLVPDAAGLATFAIAGTTVSLMLDVPWIVASFMGVMTGVLGGIFRDVLCNETPMVFYSPLYATIAWIGAIGFIGLLSLGIAIEWSIIIAGSSIFIVRLLAIRYNINLPRYRSRSDN